jgi:hypothetical protein
MFSTPPPPPPPRHTHTRTDSGLTIDSLSLRLRLIGLVRAQIRAMIIYQVQRIKFGNGFDTMTVITVKR